MKYAVAFSLLLGCSVVLLGDSPDSPYSRRPSSQKATLLEDLVRLTKAGLSDETILAYAKAHRGELPPTVSAEDLLWLRNSGVSEEVIRYMTAIEVRAADQDTEDTSEDVAYDSGETAGYSSASPYDQSYPYSESEPYPESYYNDYYPYFDYGFGFDYPYPVYFFVDGAGFFGRFRHRGFFNHGGFGRRFPRNRFDGGSGRRRGGITVGRRGDGGAGSWRSRTAPAFRQPREAVVRNGGFGRPAAPRARVVPGFRPPSRGVARGGSFGRPGGFGRPGFAGGGTMSRAPVMRSGGGGGSRSVGPGRIGRR
jgi:hypothetical protein